MLIFLRVVQDVMRKISVVSGTFGALERGGAVLPQQARVFEQALETVNRATWQFNKGLGALDCNELEVVAYCLQSIRGLCSVFLDFCVQMSVERGKLVVLKREEAVVSQQICIFERKLERANQIAEQFVQKVGGVKFSSYLRSLNHNELRVLAQHTTLMRELYRAMVDFCTQAIQSSTSVLRVVRLSINEAVLKKDSLESAIESCLQDMFAFNQDLVNMYDAVQRKRFFDFVKTGILFDHPKKISFMATLRSMDHERMNEILHFFLHKPSSGRTLRNLESINAEEVRRKSILRSVIKDIFPEFAFDFYYAVTMLFCCQYERKVEWVSISQNAELCIKKILLELGYASLVIEQLSLQLSRKDFYLADVYLSRVDRARRFVSNEPYAARVGSKTFSLENSWSFGCVAKAEQPIVGFLLFCMVERRFFDFCGKLLDCQSSSECKNLLFSQELLECGVFDVPDSELSFAAAAVQVSGNYIKL